jgi:hypothetical protein
LVTQELHDICTSSQNETRISKTKGAARTLFSRRGLYLRLQAIKLLDSLTYPLKMTKGQPTLHPNMSHDLVLVDIRHRIELSGVLRCRWRLKLLLKSGNHRYPLLELKILHLDGVLEVHNHVGTGVHLLTGDI